MLQPAPDVIQVDPLFTVKEASEMLGFKTDAWLYERIKKGRIQYVDLDPNGARPRYRIRASAINQLIDEHTFGKEAA